MGSKYYPLPVKSFNFTLRQVICYFYRHLSSNALSSLPEEVFAKLTKLRYLCVKFDTT